MDDTTPCSQGLPVIGICYDLKNDYVAQGVPAELVEGFETDTTIQAIAEALDKAGYAVLPIGDIRQLVRMLVENKGNIGVDLVFNIHSGLYGLARESQVPALLEAYRIPFALSDAATLAWCMDKAKTKMVLESHQIPTSPFVVVPALSTRDSSVAAMKYFYAALMKSKHANELAKFPLFLKPANQCCSTGISATNKVSDICSLQAELTRLSTEFPTNDILVEAFLPGREFTVGIVGTGQRARCLGIAEMRFQTRSDQTPDFYAGTLKSLDTCIDMEIVVPEEGDMEAKGAIDTGLAAWRALGCRDGGRVDIRLDRTGPDAVPNVIELSPLPGLRPGISDLATIAERAGYRYDQLICMIVDSALERSRDTKHEWV